MILLRLTMSFPLSWQHENLGPLVETSDKPDEALRLQFTSDWKNKSRDILKQRGELK